MESAVSFAPLRTAGFVNFTGRGSLFFRGAGRGGAGRASLVSTKKKPLIFQGLQNEVRR